ncbi:MAG: hypothetical protein ABEK10_03610 [Candidatus Nanosalina sp.]
MAVDDFPKDYDEVQLSAKGVSLSSDEAIPGEEFWSYVESERDVSPDDFVEEGYFSKVNISGDCFYLVTERGSNVINHGVEAGKAYFDLRENNLAESFLEGHGNPRTRLRAASKVLEQKREVTWKAEDGSMDYDATREIQERWDNLSKKMEESEYPYCKEIIENKVEDLEWITSIESEDYEDQRRFRHIVEELEDIHSEYQRHHFN